MVEGLMELQMFKVVGSSASCSSVTELSLELNVDFIRPLRV
jgi:hypothetical protein